MKKNNNQYAKDPYVYPDTGVLKNKLNCNDYIKLKELEKVYTVFQLVTIEELAKEKCDYKLLKKIHKYIFDGIYEWAGEYRTVPIYKEEIVLPGLSLEYAQPKEIDKKIKGIFKRINKTKLERKSQEEIAEKLSEILIEIWKVHPFRDGNTRTTLAFGTILGKQIGVDLNLAYMKDQLERKIDENGKITNYSVRDKMVLASLDKENKPEPQHFKKIISKAIALGNKPETKKTTENKKTTEDKKEIVVSEPIIEENEEYDENEENNKNENNGEELE